MSGIKKAFKKTTSFFRSIPKFVWVVVVLGFLIRVAGVWYGLPLALNIDEPVMISSTLALRHDINPGHFDWPHFYYYINAIPYAKFVVLRQMLSSFSDLPEVWFTASPFFLISRLVSVFFGTATIIVIYYLANMIFSKRVAYIAAVILAFLPIHVLESHYAKTDIAQTFFTAVALIFVYRVYLKAQRKDFVLAGIFIGISTSIKYGGALMFLPLIIAYLLHFSGWKEYLKKDNVVNLVLSGAVSVVAFYIGTPFALFDYRKFFSYEQSVGALWQFQNVGKSTWEEFPFELYETFVPMYQENLGLFLWLVFLLALGLFLFFNRRDDKSIFLLLPTLLFSIYISKFNRSPDHYFVFLIPLYVPAIAKLIEELGVGLYKFVNKRTSIKAKENSVVYILTAILIAPSLIASLHSSFLLSRQDTRHMAYNWVQSNLGEDSEDDYLYVHGEDLHVIPFKKNFTSKTKKVDRSILKESPPYYVVIGIEGVSKEDLTTGKRDPEIVSGNSEPILEDADLVFYADDKLRIGPPVYIFRVKSVRQD